MVHPEDPVAVEDFDLSESYRKLLPELGVLVGVPCEESVSMNDIGRRDDLDVEMEKLESMMTEVVECMESVLQGGTNCDIESDKKRRAHESVGVQDKSTTLRDCKRRKTSVVRLDAYRGGPSSESAKPGQPTAQDLPHKPSTVPASSPTVVRFVNTVSSQPPTDGNVMLLGTDTGGGRKDDATSTAASGAPKCIAAPKKVYRPPLTSNYKEPNLGPDLLENSEWIFEEHGKSLRQTADELPPRVDVIEFDLSNPGDMEELERNLSLEGCPVQLHDDIKQTIKDYWDVFCEQGLRRHIRGFTFSIDTGDTPPVCCRQPRYGPHEAKIMRKLCDALDDNGLIEDDDGPYGAQIVLAAKPGQDGVPADKFKWRLCVSYRRLNQVTRPFAFPMPRCDDAVEDIDTEAKFFIAIDLDSGYWQILAEKEARTRLAFFTPDGKKRWKVMPMGALNSAATFVAMMQKLQQQWDALAKERGINNVGSKVIVDDVLLYGRTADQLLRYFRTVLDVLKHHRATINLKKCKFMRDRCEFVGVDIVAGGNKPAESKYAAFEALGRPNTFGDLRMLIGLFGFYSKHLALYEPRIAPWRSILAQQPKPGELTKVEECRRVSELWSNEDEVILRDLKVDILKGPTLARPNHNRRFYLKSDWSKDKMGAVLLQADDSPQAIKAEAEECAGGKCAFDRTKSGLRLRPIAFISRMSTEAELSYHSYVGEAATGRWAIGKFRKYLTGREFTWLTDCSGLRQFFESDIGSNRTLQRWRAEMIQFHFMIEHRPAAMLTECDTLSRYNAATAEWRRQSEIPAMLTVPSQLSLFSSHNRTRAATESTEEPFVIAGAALQLSPSVHVAAIEPYDDKPPYWLRQEEDVPGVPTALTHLPLFPAMLTSPSTPFTVAPPVYVGTDLQSPTKAMEPRRTVLALGALGCPVSEALIGVGLDPTDSVIHAEFNAQTDLPGALQLFWPSHDMDAWIEQLHDALDNDVPHVDWLVAIYNGPQVADGKPDGALEDWCGRMVGLVTTLHSHCGLTAAILLCPQRWPDALRRVRKLREPVPGWTGRSFTIRNTAHGGSIETDHQALCLLPDKVANALIVPDVSMEAPEPMSLSLDMDLSGSDFLWMNDLQTVRSDPVHHARETTHSSHVERLVKHRCATKPTFGHPTFSTRGPAPSIATPEPHEEFFNAPFAIWFGKNNPTGKCCRPVRRHELWKLFGLDDNHVEMMSSIPSALALDRARQVPGRAGLEMLFDAIRTAEARTSVEPGSNHTALAFPAMVLDPALVLPLPTSEQWKDATSKDPDLRLILDAAIVNAPPLQKSKLKEKGYFDAWKNGRLEVEDGMVFHYEEPFKARRRQLRTKVVPPSLRRTVVAACHVSPMAGHSGIQRTQYRLATRFWWPTLNRETRLAVSGCAHCRLANIASHEAQMQLHSLSCDVPFDIMFLDIWSPGDIAEANGASKILTGMCCMTGFANGGSLQKPITAESVSLVAFSQMFIPNGLPRLIFVDQEGVFKGVFMELFGLLGIPVEAVAPENHKAIRCERFHRYLNKVQTINTADKQSFHQWHQGVMFALYAWNAGPIDGTDIPRSVAAIGREFPFPIDLTNGATPRDGISEGQSAMDHCDAASPLLIQATTTTSRIE